jgi:hypothetical protein
MLGSFNTKLTYMRTDNPFLPGPYGHCSRDTGGELLLAKAIPQYPVDSARDAITKPSASRMRQSVTLANHTPGQAGITLASHLKDSLKDKDLLNPSARE